MSEQQIEQVELSITQAKKAINLMKDLDRLNDYPPFKNIILENLFKDTPIRLVMLKSDASMQSERDQQNIEREMFSIGHLREHFRNIYAFGRIAEKTLKEHEDTHAELMGEV